MLLKSQQINWLVAVFIALSAASNFLGKTVAADEAETSLVTTILQDEQRRLPPDNTVLFSAATRSVALQLDALNQLDSSELAGTMLTVISSEGETRELVADNSGVVQITDVEPGAYAVVANNDDAHGTTLLVFEQQATADNAPDAPAASSTQPVGKARMTLIEMKSTELLPIVDKYLSASANADGRFVESDWGSKNGFGASAFKVRVGDDNELYGRVIPLLRSDLSGSNVEGTHITLLSGGSKVGGAFADAAGNFSVPDVAPGIYGIVAAGPAGYGSFAFEVVHGMAVVQKPKADRRNNSQQLVSTFSATAEFENSVNSVPGEMIADVVPCVCIPPQYVPYAVESIREYYPPLAQDTVITELGGVSPVPGIGGIGPTTLGPGGFSPVGFGGPTGVGVGGAGFGGGFGGIGAIGAIGAVIAASSNNSGSGGLVPSLPVSPASP